MIERGGRAGFLLEARDAVTVRGHALRQDLDRDLPMEAAVVRAIDLAHTANTQDSRNLVRTELCPGWDGHVGAILIAVVPIV